MNGRAMEKRPPADDPDNVLFITLLRPYLFPSVTENKEQHPNLAHYIVNAECE